MTEMSEIYIRASEGGDTRGPFNVPKLQSLAEAEQVTGDTLYYDDANDAWTPIRDNPELLGQIFPERRKLSLNPNKRSGVGAAGAAGGQGAQGGDDQAAGISVQDFLSAAEGQSAETRHLKKSERRLEIATKLAPPGLALTLLASAAFLLAAHSDPILKALQEGNFSAPANYPFVVIGALDLILAVALFLAVTELYPVLRARAMLTAGFGAYVGWALGDPWIAFGCLGGGIGIFWATLSSDYRTMLVALLLGVGGHGALAYLATHGYFDGFLEAVSLNLVTRE